MTTRRYKITVKGRTYDVEVGDLSSTPVTVTVDGTPYQVDLPPGLRAPAQAPAPGPAAPAPRMQPQPPTSPAPVTGQPSSVLPPTPRPVMPAAGGLAAGDQSVVRALMPGRILRVNVEQGAQVQRGQPLLVMESMKMEQTIAAPREGRVKSVMVDPGDSVTRGQTLIELE